MPLSAEWSIKVFRRLRAATKDAVFGICKLLKKLEQNFKWGLPKVKIKKERREPIHNALTAVNAQKVQKFNFVIEKF